MDKIKVYIKCKDKKCVFCHQDIIMKYQLQEENLLF